MLLLHVYQEIKMIEVKELELLVVYTLKQELLTKLLQNQFLVLTL